MYWDFYECKTELDCMAEQRMCEIWEMGFDTVEEWLAEFEKKTFKMEVPVFARGVTIDTLQNKSCNSF